MKIFSYLHILGNNKAPLGQGTNKKPPTEQVSVGGLRFILCERSRILFVAFVCVSNYKKRKDR